MANRLNYPYYIARKSLGKGKGNFSRPLIRLSIISIALSLAVMILSVSIVIGYKKAIREKVIGFGSHIQVLPYSNNYSFESDPIPTKQSFYPYQDDIEGIRHVQTFATKPGIIKTDDQIEGVVLKGIDDDFDWDFFESKIIKGSAFTLSPSEKSEQILISKATADRLMLDTGDRVNMYFINPQDIRPRGRRFFVSGIYETGMENMDKLYVIGDIRHIQKLNRWDSSEVSGFEIFIDDFDELEQMTELIDGKTTYDSSAYNIKQLRADIFDWISLFDLNVIIILSLMILVAVINMISTIFILILEKTNLIGLMKALGSSNWGIRRIFLFVSGRLIIYGLLWGNLISLALGFCQKQFGFIKLDQTSYFVSEVPVDFNFWNILMLNAGTIAVILIILLIPSYVISKISPVKAIRFN